MTTTTTEPHRVLGAASVVAAPKTCPARRVSVWWPMSKDTSHTNQVLDAERELPDPEPIRQDLFIVVLSAIRKGVPIPELRGLRLTWGMLDTLLNLAHFAGTHGDRAFATNRRIAARSGRAVRTVAHARQMARSAGLLTRRTHGAGRYLPGSAKGSGALDILSFPGGTEGAKRLLARLRDGENLEMGSRRPTPVRRTPSELSVDAQRILDQDPGLAARIARELDQPRNDEGALRVVAHILARAPRRKLRVPGAYIMTAVRRDRKLRTLWPATSAPSLGAEAVRDSIGTLSNLLKMPD